MGIILQIFQDHQLKKVSFYQHEIEKSWNWTLFIQKFNAMCFLYISCLGLGLYFFHSRILPSSIYLLSVVNIFFKRKIVLLSFILIFWWVFISSSTSICRNKCPFQWNGFLSKFFVKIVSQKWNFSILMGCLPLNYTLRLQFTLLHWSRVTNILNYSKIVFSPLKFYIKFQ